IERARNSPRRIALPEGTDGRVLEAASRLAREGIARPVIVGEAESCRDSARLFGIELAGVEIVDPASSPRRSAYEELLFRRMESKGISPQETRALAAEPLHFADLMVRAGDADGAVAGAAHSSAETLRAALRCIGPAPGVRRVSTFFLMEMPDGSRSFLFADCGLIPEPDEEDLVEVAETTARSARLLLETEPYVALLSFSTKGSADHPAARKVARAAAMLKSRCPAL